jgi:dienelactone hydrolase
MTEFSAIHQQLIDSVPLDGAADIRDETVTYQLDGVDLEGYIAWNASAPGPRPGVVVIHDWTGLREYPKARAQMLARLGYVGIAIDIYGMGVRPTGDAAAEEAGRYYQDPDLLRSRVGAGFRMATADPRVDSDRVAVIGYCFGGSATLEFARSGAPARGFASFHGALSTHEPADVDAIAAPLLVLTGGSDPVVPDDAVVAFENELRRRDDLDWQVVTYAGAPHAFTLPGIANYRPTADRRSWNALEAFLTEVFA